MNKSDNDTTKKAPPMNLERFQRMKAAFERRGGKIHQDADAQLILDVRGAEALVMSPYDILARREPSAAAIFEEFIHTAQMKQGKITSLEIDRTIAEIEAKEKLLRNQKAYSLSAIEVKETEIQLRLYRERLKKLMNAHKKRGTK